MTITLKEWRESGKSFDEFIAGKGCFIDEETYNYFLEILPPVYGNTKGLFQVPEACDSRNGKFTYSTFDILPTENPSYLYLGELTRKEFNEL